MNDLKTVGTRTLAASAQESLRTGMKLRRTALRLGKWRPARGFVVVGRTREEAEARWSEVVTKLQAAP